MLSKETSNTNSIVFDLTRPGLEPMIYRTRGEHANHYTTDFGYSIFYMDQLISFYSLISVGNELQC